MTDNVVMRDGKRFVDHPTDGLLEVKYGLPADVQFCTRCVISNQRPSSGIEFATRTDTPKQTIRFDGEGVCDACRFAERKDKEVDWAERERALITLCDEYRSRNGSYDCLVPGSGGKDSVYASHILKTKYNMHPLTVTWAPHLYTDVGWKNFQGWVHKGGFDNYLMTPDGHVHRLLTRLAYINLLHPFQPFVLGQKNFAPRFASRMNIPLVFYGENEAEYGNPISQNSTAKRESSYYAVTADSNEELFFSGLPMSELEKFGINRRQLEPYMPSTTEELEASNIDVHYLGYYLKWTPQECFYYSVEHTGFEANPERTEGTYSKYNSIDDKTDGFHYWTTYVKFGIGRTTYDAAQEIRNHHIDREEGVALVNRYDGEFPTKYFPEFCKYVSLDPAEFMEIADSYRSPHLWTKKNGAWQLRYKVT